jgi:hypothetical protein
MATWEGEAWLGSASGRQKVRVQSNTFQGAKEQIEQIYGSTDVWNLREVRSSSSSSSSEGVFSLLVVLFAISLIVQFWHIAMWIILGLLILGVVGYIFGDD